MEQAVRDIAAAGYTGTEMFDGNLAAYADRPDELRGLLSDNGLSWSASTPGPVRLP